MADSQKSKSGGGCLGRMTVLLLLLAAGGLVMALFFAAQPQDLSDIGGAGPSVGRPASRDLRTVLKSSLDRGHSVALTETELNHWLARTLTVKQGGLLASEVSLNRVLIRLEDGCAEVVMERTFMGRPFTVSMFLKVEQTEGPRGVRTEVHRHGGPYHANLPKPLRGGRFGRLVVPQGFLILVLPSYKKLAELYREEIRLAFEEMARIRIEPNRLILDPQAPSGDAAGLPQTF